MRADGRCLFRAIAHMACLRKGEEAPDEIRQQELADELRAQVCDLVFVNFMILLMLQSFNCIFIYVLTVEMNTMKIHRLSKSC